jgi:glyoxylate reductase
MSSFETLLITHRGLFQQQNLVSAAPEELHITVRRDISKADMLELLQDMEFLISEREDVIDADMIAAGRKLRLIQRLGSQTWDIDLEAARRAGIPVCHWPDQSTINVAEHCLMMTLDLIKKSRDCMNIMNSAAWTLKSRRSDEDTFAYNWSGRIGISTLRGMKAGILGFGEIGRELAVRLRGFETNVLYHKRRRMPADAEAQIGIMYAEPQEITRQVDVLYCLLPYSQEADQSLNRDFFKQMKPGSYFVFCGGSGVVDENGLIEALTTGRLAGAALDTYTWEPLPAASPLLVLYRDLSVNLILTPHIAAGTIAGGRAGDYTNLTRLFTGQELLYRVV